MLEIFMELLCAGFVFCVILFDILLLAAEEPLIEKEGRDFIMVDGIKLHKYDKCGISYYQDGIEHTFYGCTIFNIRAKNLADVCGNFCLKTNLISATTDFTSNYHLVSNKKIQK